MTVKHSHSSTLLNPMDSVFYNFDTETTHQAIASFCLLESMPNWEMLQKRVSGILEKFPKLRQRISANRWVEDVEFSLENHLQFSHMSHLRDKEDLFRCLGGIFSKKLSFSRPLWRFTLISNRTLGAEKSEQKKVVAGMLFCIHHALADGLGGLELVAAVTSSTPECGAQKEVSSDNARKPTNTSHDVKEQRQFGGSSFKKCRVSSLFKVLGEMTSFRRRSLLNGSNSKERDVTAIELPFALLQSYRRRVGVSLNDVLLAIVTNAVRLYHDKSGGSINKLRVIVPVNLRNIGERWELGNRITGVGVDLPVAIEEPVEQLQVIHDSFSRLRTSGAFGAYAFLANVIANVPKPLQRVLCELQASRNNFICTNMSGWKRPKYICGAKVKGNYPLVALMRNHGVAFGFITHAEKVCTTVVSDKAIVKDPSLLTQCINEATIKLLSKGDTCDWNKSKVTIASSSGL